MMYIREKQYCRQALHDIQILSLSLGNSFTKLSNQRKFNLRQEMRAGLN